MKIVWFSWKDINHPQAGGAEAVSWQLMKQLVKSGHQVRLITAQYPGVSKNQVVDGVGIYRQGGRYSVYSKARKAFKRTMPDWPDLIIDEMNTLPFGTAFYTKKPCVLLTYQLAREVWKYQAPFPVSHIGYALEPFYLRLLSRKYKRVVTESESTRQDLARYGFDPANTHVFRVSIDHRPLTKLGVKQDLSNILILGSIRPMKRTLEAVKAFEAARDSNKKIKLTLAGDDSDAYARQVKAYVAASRHASAIKVLGRVSSQQRLDLMRDAAVILVTSIKEGWGLIVTEANSQGAPAIVYDCDGLRDSVKQDQTGLLIKPGDFKAMATALNKLLEDRQRYGQIRQAAWQDSKQYTLKNSYNDFLVGLGLN